MQQHQRFQQLQQQQQARQMLMNSHMYPGMQMGTPMMNMNPQQQLSVMRQRAAAMGQVRDRESSY